MAEPILLPYRNSFADDGIEQVILKDGVLLTRAPRSLKRTLRRYRILLGVMFFAVVLAPAVGQVVWVLRGNPLPGVGLWASARPVGCCAPSLLQGA